MALIVRDATRIEPEITSERLGDRLDFLDLVGAIQAGSDVHCLRGSGAPRRTGPWDCFPAADIDLATLYPDREAAAWARRLVADVDALERVMNL